MAGIVRVPAIYGVTAAAVVVAIGLQLPLVVMRPITLLSDAALPMMLLVLGMLGCGSSGNPVPTNPMVGTYSVTVAATATSGPARSATVSVTITQ